jgi:GntR family transcriptional regulator, rspAB operon transcriptional repressor
MANAANDVATGKEPDLVRTSIYRRLRGEVLSCALLPGQQLQERDLVARFRVSKSPIRDALLKLEEQGLVEILPRRGYRVTRIDAGGARDMYGLRHLFERECAALLIDAAPDAVLDGLEAFRSAPASRDLPDWIAYNRSFHVYIAAHCGNALLGRLAQDLIEHFDRLTYLSVTRSAEMSLDAYVREHGAIIDAIQARDKPLAAALLGSHIERSRRRVLGRLAAADFHPEAP